MTAPTILLVEPTAFCACCASPVRPGEAFCSAECKDKGPAEEPVPESFTCPVCRSANDLPGCCSKPCYDLWTAPSDDEDDRFRF